MKVIFNTWSILVVTGKRLLAQKGLALAITIGLTVAVALAVSLPVYSDAVNFRILTTELNTVPGSGGQIARRSPFAFMFRYVAGVHKALKWSDIGPLDTYLHGSASNQVGLPRKFIVRYLATDNLKLFPGSDSAFSDSKESLGWVNIGSITDLQSHITVVEGSFPEPAPATPDSIVDVLISEDMATQDGIQVGDTFIAFDANQSLQEKQKAFYQIPVRIAGVWKASNPKDEYWFYDPTALSNVLLVPEASLRDRIGSHVDHEISTALWYMVLDGSGVRASDAGTIRSRIISLEQRVKSFLPNISMDSSPMEALTTYQLRTSWLSVLLYAFSIPIIGLVLAFIGIVAGLSVERQRSEIAILRSRGATVTQVFSINLLQGILVGIIALAAGIFLGQWLAYLIGRTRSFLDFSGASNLRVVLTNSAWQFGLALLGLAILAQAIPVIGAAQHTIITYKQERARTLQRPWWQRAWLDVLLLIPTGYGIYVLRQQGSIVSPTVSPNIVAQAGTLVSNALPSDPFQNPLLFLVPALGALALTLLMLRALPPIMSAIAWLASHTQSVGILLAARHLARTHNDYAGPLMLLIVTLGLSTYTASLAQTLDSHAYDQTYYAIGADMHLAETGQSSSLDEQMSSQMPGQGETANPQVQASAEATPEPQSQPQGRVWEFQPVQDHLQAPGVKAAARVSTYRVSTRMENNQATDLFMGVDRLDFPRVAYWRPDFAPTSLGALMNALALTNDGVLIPRSAAAQYGLKQGDTMRIIIYGPNGQVETSVHVVGFFNLFPTWYPGDGMLLVGNNDFLFEQLGGEVPYDVWLKTEPSADGDQIVASLRDLGFQISTVQNAAQQVKTEMSRAERQGLYGVLSVGFAAAAFLAAFGFLLNMLFSFRRRYIELGILRAIGLSAQQMTLLLASELAFLIITALVVGTALGAWMSKLFIPYLQVGNTLAARIPPYLVTIGWDSIVRIYILLGVLFVVTLALLAGLLLRMRINQAVKLGETG